MRRQNTEATDIVCSIAMVVDTTKESSRRVFSNVLHQQMATTWVLVNKIGDIVYESSNANQRSFLGLFAILRTTVNSTSTRHNLTVDVQDSHEMTGRSSLF
jgi:hypothetical protein